jgi:hypothetical protein
MPVAALVGAAAKRSQQVALRAPDQIDACSQRARQPLFEREPPRKASLAYGSGSSPRHGWPPLTRCFVLAMPFAPELCSRHQKPSQEAFPRISSLKKEGRRSAKRRGPGRIIKRCGAHPFSRPPFSERTEATGTSRSGRARLSAPHRGTRRVSSRLGLGRASWNHRMQAGGPSPAPVQRAPRSPDTRRTGRCPSRPWAQCIAATHENRSRSASRSTLASGVLRERDGRKCNRDRNKVKGNVALLGTRRRGGLAQRNPPSDCREAADYPLAN